MSEGCAAPNNAGPSRPSVPFVLTFASDVLVHHRELRVGNDTGLTDTDGTASLPPGFKHLASLDLSNTTFESDGVCICTLLARIASASGRLPALPSILLGMRRRVPGRFGPGIVLRWLPSAFMHPKLLPRTDACSATCSATRLNAWSCSMPAPHPGIRRRWLCGTERRRDARKVPRPGAHRPVPGRTRPHRPGDAGCELPPAALGCAPRAGDQGEYTAARLPPRRPP